MNESGTYANERKMKTKNEHLVDNNFHAIKGVIAFSFKRMKKEKKTGT